jgi:predicted outer membrane lipoprotein
MDAKPWYLSKGIWGSLIAVAFGILAAFGIKGAEGEQENVLELVMQIIAVIGGVVAFLGRIKANTKITK